jgi:hypothetical protein
MNLARANLQVDTFEDLLILFFEFDLQAFDLKHLSLHSTSPGRYCNRAKTSIIQPRSLAFNCFGSTSNRAILQDHLRGFISCPQKRRLLLWQSEKRGAIERGCST